MIAVVPGDIDAAFGAGEEQSLAFRVFPDRVDGLVVGQAACYLLPGLAAVVGAIDIRMQVVKPEAIHGCVGSWGIEMRRIHLRYFGPRRYFGRSYVLPVLAAVARYLNHAIVGSGPDQIRIFGRWRNRIDYAAMFALGRIVRNKRAQG